MHIGIDLVDVARVQALIARGVRRLLELEEWA